MSETLLNSIGVRGNRSFYMTPVSAVPQNNTKPQIEKKEENNPQKSSKMLTLGLAGLAVIGGGVVVAKRDCRIERAVEKAIFISA